MRVCAEVDLMPSRSVICIAPAAWDIELQEYGIAALTKRRPRLHPVRARTAQRQLLHAPVHACLTSLQRKAGRALGACARPAPEPGVKLGTATAGEGPDFHLQGKPAMSPGNPNQENNP